MDPEDEMRNVKLLFHMSLYDFSSGGDLAAIAVRSSRTNCSTVADRSLKIHLKTLWSDGADGDSAYSETKACCE